MLIILDNALEQRLGGFVLDGVTVPVRTKESYRELANKEDYDTVAIVYERIDKMYDRSRVNNDTQKILKDYVGDVPTNVDVFESPEPYNFMYQVELLAPTRYEIDSLELFIDSALKPNGDCIYATHKIDGVDVNNKFPIFLRDYKPLDEKDPVYYRRVYTYLVKTSIDFKVLVEGSKVLKGAVETQLERKEG